MDAEQQLREQIALCWDDPLRYVMLAFPWGVKGGPLENHTGPDEWQVEQLNAIRDHIRSGKDVSFRDATTSGHGIGKTAETSWVILWAMSTRPNLAGVVTANTQAQLTTKTWRELSLWHKRSINAHWFKWTATRFCAVESPETWGVSAIPWSESNPEAFAGLHADDVLVIYDEASAVADCIWDVTEGAMTTPGAMWFVYGNPTRNSGKFRECWRSQRHRWNSRQVDSRTCKMTNKAEIQQWVDDYGEDSDFVRVRVRGLFPRISSNQLVSPDDIERARLRNILESEYTRYPVILGVDVARFGDDSSVVIRRQGPKVWKPVVYRGINTMALAANVMLLANKHNADVICVDGVGVGAGVVDRLAELRMPVVDVQSAAAATDPRKYINTRSELWGRVAEFVESADLPDDKELLEELGWPEYGYNTKLQIQVESTKSIKEREGRSPDNASALIMTMTDGDRIAFAMGERQQVVASKVQQSGNMGAWS